MKTTVHYHLLADLFDYPDTHFVDRVRKVAQFLEKNYPAAFEDLKVFSEAIPEMSQNEREELFTRSFDVQSATTLDIGYVMFGDDYKRGELLANLNREQQKVKNDCGHELADHLPNVLRLMSKLKNPELLEELVSEIVGPALQKMIGEFDPRKLDEKGKKYKKHYKTLIELNVQRATIYGGALKAMHKVLKSDFVFDELQILRPTADFLKSVVQEMEIEEEAVKQ